jgi:acetyltransferase
MAIHYDETDSAWPRMLPDGRVLTLRRMSPSDIDIVRAYLAALSYGDSYFRYGRAGFRLSEADVMGLCDRDPHSGRHDIAVLGEGADERVVANADCTLSPDGVSCEFGILVAANWRGRGIARWMMERMAGHAKALGARSLVAETMTSNRRMIGFARHLGFRSEADAGRPAITRLELVLA